MSTIWNCMKTFILYVSEKTNTKAILSFIYPAVFTKKVYYSLFMSNLSFIYARNISGTGPNKVRLMSIMEDTWDN